MNEIVERVARALRQHPDEDGSPNESWDTTPDPWKPHYRSLARAAIEAMRDEPFLNPAMTLAGIEAHAKGHAPQAIWRAMINEALK